MWRHGAQLLRKYMHVFTFVLCWICYLAELLYECHNCTTCIYVQSPSCTWHTHLQQTKQNLAFTAPLSVPESVHHVGGHWFNRRNGETETSCFGAADLCHVPSLFRNRRSALHVCSAGSNIYGHRFIWQLSVATPHRVPYRSNPLNAELNPICHLLALLGAYHILHVSGLRVNLAHSSDFPPAWRNNSGKRQTIVVSFTDFFTTARSRRYLCVWFYFRD